MNFDFLQSANVTNYPQRQFVIFRILLGIYIFILFLFSIFNFDDFNWVSNLAKSPANIIFLYVGLSSSLLLMLGIKRKINTIVIWIVLNYLIYKNIFFYGVNLDYIGFLLLITLFVDSDESWNSDLNKNWGMNKLLYMGVWISFMLGMTVSGINKMVISSEWRNGEVILGLFGDAPITNSAVLSDFVYAHPLVMKLTTYLTLFLEVGSFFFIFNRKLRSIYSFLTIVMFLLIATFATMRDVALSALLVEIFLIDWSFSFDVKA